MRTCVCVSGNCALILTPFHFNAYYYYMCLLRDCFCGECTNVCVCVCMYLCVTDTAGMPAFTRDASGQRVRLDDDAAATARAAAGIAGTVSGSGCNDGTQSAARPGPPDSSAAFERHWRRQCATDALKYQYVLSLPPSCIESIFKVEMSSVLLAESIVACRNELSRRLDTHDVDTTMPPANPESTLTLSSGGGVDDAERRLVADVLLAMSRTGRFNLNSKLIGRRAKDALRELIDTILAPGLADETASTLRATFAL